MVKLSDGKEYTADLYKLTIAEVRTMLTDSADKALEDACISKAYGIPAVSELPYPDYRLLIPDFIEALRKPLENPT
jgi:hypothetical protein